MLPPCGGVYDASRSQHARQHPWASLKHVHLKRMNTGIPNSKQRYVFSRPLPSCCADGLAIPGAQQEEDRFEAAEPDGMDLDEAERRAEERMGMTMGAEDEEEEPGPSNEVRRTAINSRSRRLPTPGPSELVHLNNSTDYKGNPFAAALPLCTFPC